jgi:hypothetical protein
VQAAVGDSNDGTMSGLADIGLQSYPAQTLTNGVS